MFRPQAGTKNQVSTQPGPSNQLLTIPSFSDSGDADTQKGGDGPNAPWWRRRGGIITIAVILLVILLGVFFLSALNRRPQVTFQYQKVTQGDLSLTVSATGPVQSGTYNLIFAGTGGKIDEIDVKVGQKVTKDQVLAQLNKTSLQDAVNQQQIAVDNAQKALNNALAASGATAAQSNASVGSSQTGLNNAQANQTQTQAQAQASINTSQTALDNANANLGLVQQTVTAQEAVAKTQHDQQIASCNATATAVAEITPLPGTPAPTASPTCTQLADNQYNQAVAQAQQTLAQAQQVVKSDQVALNQAKANATASATTAQGSVNSAQGTLNSSQAGANASDTTAQNAVTQAAGSLNSAQALLDQAKHNLDNATLKAPHDGVVSIINGTVGGQAGASASGTAATSSAGGGTFIQIVDLSALQIQSNVNESDTANLKVGQAVTFTINAYGDRQFQGTVSAIPPIGQTAANVVTYPVSIDIDMNSLKGANLLPGMTANVTITVVQRPGVLQIPVNAVNFARLASSGNTASGTPQLITKQEAASEVSNARQMLNQLEAQNADVVNENPIPAFVLEKLGNKFVAKPVVLGLTDGTSYEVLTGLSQDETFLAGTVSSQNTGSGAPGGGGGVRVGGGG